MVTSDDVGGEFKPERGVFVNRTLNMRSVEAVGYDMDYTLIHYNVDMWEGAAFDEARDLLAAQGYPVADLQFDPEQFTIGFVFDLKLGNVVKATRFGYVVRAQHGNELLSFEEQRDVYREDIVELSSSRFEFMNTLFELSRASLFTQLVALIRCQATRWCSRLFPAVRRDQRGTRRGPYGWSAQGQDRCRPRSFCRSRQRHRSHAA